MSALVLAVLTLLAVSPVDAGAQGGPLGEAAGVTAADVGACCDGCPGGDDSDERPCPEGGCCAVCAPCCTRIAWSQPTSRLPDAARDEAPVAEAKSPPGADPPGAVWHPPRG